MRISKLIVAGVLTAMALGTACGGGHRAVTVAIPPKLDLHEYGVSAALFTFAADNAKGSLQELATNRFAEKVLAAARGIEILELGSQEPLLKESGDREFGGASARLVGATRQVPVVFAGRLKVSNAKPSGGLSALGIPHFEADIQVELSVALYSTRSGGTLWRAASSATDKVGEVTLIGGVPSFSAKDPNAAYGQLVNRLVANVTRDFYPTFERR